MNNIPSRRIFYPLHLQPCLKDIQNVININDEFPGSNSVFREILSLPSSILMKENQFKHIIETLNSY